MLLERHLSGHDSFWSAFLFIISSFIKFMSKMHRIMVLDWHWHYGHHKTTLDHVKRVAIAIAKEKAIAKLLVSNKVNNPMQ